MIGKRPQRCGLFFLAGYPSQSTGSGKRFTLADTGADILSVTVFLHCPSPTDSSRFSIAFQTPEGQAGISTVHSPIQSAFIRDVICFSALFRV